MARFSAVLLALLALSLPASAQTVDELVARNLQARGGLEKLKAAQTLKLVARLSSQGMELPMTLYAKRPNLARKELSLGQQTMLLVFDGTSAWQVNPLQSASTMPVEIVGPDLESIRQESDFDSPFVDYQSRGYTIELAGTETTGGRTLHHLRLTRRGATQECYLDAATGLEARTVNRTAMGVLEQELSDYRDVQGLQIPFTIRTLQNGVRVSAITVERVEINSAMDDGLFKRPAK